MSGAGLYYIYREWFNRDANTSSPGFEFMGTTSNTSFVDFGLGATSYNGTSIPGPHAHGYIGYYIYAGNGLDWGPHSGEMFWTLAP